MYHLAGNVARILPGEEQEAGRDFVGLARAAHGCVLAELRTILLRLPAGPGATAFTRMPFLTRFLAGERDRLRTAFSQTGLSPMSPATTIALRPSLSTISSVLAVSSCSHKDVRAFADEQSRRPAADASIGAGNQRDLALQAIVSL
jgi:hypothetical protein